ncbi:hypothetical protein THAOC_02563, partial [Thalassiosira oceanica]
PVAAATPAATPGPERPERVEPLVAGSLGGIAGALSWRGSRAGRDGDGSAAAEDGRGDGGGGSSAGGSPPDAPAFHSSPSSASSCSSAGEGVEQTTVVLDMAADYFRRMEARAEDADPETSSEDGTADGGESETVVGRFELFVIKARKRKNHRI